MTCVALCLATVALGTLPGCGGGQPGAGDSDSIFDDPWAKPSLEGIDTADLRALFFGNSHTMVHDVSGTVRGLMEAAEPNKSFFTTARSGALLEDINENPENHKIIAEHQWDVIVLQGQSISMSGKYRYSQVGAIGMAQDAEAHGARVLLFAEWARYDVDEGDHIQEIYGEIAAETKGAVVVPVGTAFELAAAERPELVLHDEDGNHSSPHGAYLAACVLMGAITGHNPAEIPDARADKIVPDLPSAERKFLRGIAGKALIDAGFVKKAAK